MRNIKHPIAYTVRSTDEPSWISTQDVTSRRESIAEDFEYAANFKIIKVRLVPEKDYQAMRKALKSTTEEK